MQMKIKALREQAKLTQAELAQRINMRQSTVSMWETGESLPRADLLPQLAKIFDCTIDDLYRKEGE